MRRRRLRRLTGRPANPMMNSTPCPHGTNPVLNLMRIAYLECFSGISGDMFLGALVDAGVPPELFTRTVSALGIEARLEISRVQRSGISAIKLDVITPEGKELPREEYLGLASTHDLAHGHTHDHGHEHSHEHGKHELMHHHAHRGLKEIRDIIGKAAISESAKQRAIRIFEVLGAAEAKIHNTDIEKIHFHEVGAIDAIVDIVCAAVGAEALGVDAFVCSPLNVGGGMVTCAHGTFPIPAPATLEMLKDAPIYSGEIQKELVTPTGAAIVRVLASRFAGFPRMKAEKVGYGAGSRDIKNHPNVLRITIGETEQDHAAAAPEETISILEANVDDMTPQVFGYVMDRVLQEGALDVFGTSLQMKKNRPGMLLTVLCKPLDAERLTRLIFAETTTLGVRMREEKRACLTRRWLAVGTRWGDVRMKVANLNGSVCNCAPEYEDCRKIAEEHRIPLKLVMQEALRIYLERNDG
jgi:pyridinium-3,5-bisthiocarboxylic acid mononucleotide nickel chelatase